MLETIKNGFVAIIDILTTVWTFVVNIISSVGNLLVSLPDIIKTITAAVGLLPTVLLSAALFCLTIRLIVITLNRNAGDS